MRRGEKQENISPPGDDKSEVKYWRDVINNEISIVFWPASYEAQTQYPIKNNEVVQDPLNLIEIV